MVTVHDFHGNKNSELLAIVSDFMASSNCENSNLIVLYFRRDNEQELKIAMTSRLNIQLFG